jgi:uncharacterized protein YrrD
MVVNPPIIGDFGFLVNLAGRLYNETMFVLAHNLVGLPVISLQTGETVATVMSPVIRPEQLRLMAFTLNAGRNPRTLLVMSGVRQIALDCVIIDNDDELAEPDDIVRLTDLLKSGYTPIGKAVVTESGERLGSVEDYTLNLETELVQKLYIKPPLLKIWYSSHLIIDRSQIIDVQPQRFVVRDSYEKVTALVPEPNIAEPG